MYVANTPKSALGCACNKCSHAQSLGEVVQPQQKTDDEKRELLSDILLVASLASLIFAAFKGK